MKITNRSTSYFVQVQINGGLPHTIFYSKEGFKFMDEKSARKLLEEEKKSDPKQKYRIVKYVEQLGFSNWE